MEGVKRKFYHEMENIRNEKREYICVIKVEFKEKEGKIIKDKLFRGCLLGVC